MNQLELSRLRRRCERLLEILDGNYPNIILKNEIRLINEASNNLCNEMDKEIESEILTYKLEYPYSVTSIEYPDFYNYGSTTYTVAYTSSDSNTKIKEK